MSYSKGRKVYSVEVLQQDNSYREVFSSTKRDDCYKWIRDHRKDNYIIRLVARTNRKVKHHGYDDFYERS